MNAAVLNALISLIVGIAQIIVKLHGNAALQPQFQSLMTALDSLIAAHQSNPPASPPAPGDPGRSGPYVAPGRVSSSTGGIWYALWLLIGLSAGWYVAPKPAPPRTDTHADARGRPDAHAHARTDTDARPGAGAGPASRLAAPAPVAGDAAGHGARSAAGTTAGGSRRGRRGRRP